MNRNMNKSTVPIATGVALTMAAAATVYAMNNKKTLKSKTKKLKRTAGKAVREVGEVVNDFTSMMR